MENHPVITLAQQVELQYAKEMQKHFSVVKKQRSEKLYKLIIQAKNEEQLEKSLLFRKLFGKPYSEKNDYLWRNEIRLLKEILESFLIQKQHEFISKNNEAYNQWLLVQAYDKMKFSEGVDEAHQELFKEKDSHSSYAFVLDACITQLNNVNYKIPDLAKRLDVYPELIEEGKNVLIDLISAYCARLNVFATSNNWIAYNHKTEERQDLFIDNYSIDLRKNPISNFYNHYALSFTTSDDINAYKNQLQHLNNAIEIIEPLYAKNKLLHESRFMVLMSKGREQSANGYFLDANETLSKIKVDADKLNIHNKTIFYVNYITNLVKCGFYKEALHTIEYEFSTENLLYKNMILQSRLLCYLFLRDVTQLKEYISYDLDAAPFPLNYMLKTIKSAYFYLIEEYDTALSIINSLLTAKYAADFMQYYKPISLIYKKLYTTAQKNALQKKWTAKDKQSLQESIHEFEESSPPEMKKVSTYLWLKAEIDRK